MLSWFARFLPRARRVSLSEEVWARSFRRLRAAAALAPAERERLREFTERFLADKAISAAGGMRLTDDRRLLIAAACCLPVLRLGYDWLQGWHEVIVYPGEFGVRRRDYDEHTGVVEEWDDTLVGESWDRGPLVLSWADVRADLDRPEPGFHVVVHEIAHKLDALDGSMDGTPPLRDARQREAWVAAFQSAFDALRADVDAGREPPIDAYAAEAPDEFFAVASEYHFTAPDTLRAVYPEVAAQLRRFYGGGEAAAG